MITANSNRARGEPHSEEEDLCAPTDACNGIEVACESRLLHSRGKERWNVSLLVVAVDGYPEGGCSNRCSGLIDRTPVAGLFFFFFYLMNDWIRRDCNDPTIRHCASKLSMHRCKIFCQKSNRLVSRNATNIGLLILLIFASQEDYFKRIKKKR